MPVRPRPQVHKRQHIRSLLFLLRERKALKTLQELIQQMRQESPHRHKFTEAAMVCAWKAIMPQAVCNRTVRAFYKQGKLFLQLNSAPLRQELQLNKRKVLALLKAHTKDDELQEVIFL